MAKKNRHIDDLFKGKMQSAKLPLDGSEWNKLFDELHPKKKKRFVWWWFALPLGLLVAASILFYPWSNNTSNTPVVQTEVSNASANNSGNNAAVEPLSKADELKPSNVPSEEETINISGVEQQGYQKATNETTAQKAPAKTSKLMPSSGYVEHAKPPVDDGNNDENASSPRKDKQPIVTLVKVFPKSEVSLFPWNWKWPDLATIQLTGPSLKEAVDSSTNKRPTDTYIGLSGGMLNYNQRLTSTDTNYLRYKNGNESVITLPSFGMEVGTTFKGFEWTSGLLYTQKGQQSAPEFRYAVYDSVPHKNTNGDTVGWARWNYRDTTVSRKNSPKYSYLSLPIGLSKSFKVNEKWFVSVGIQGSLQYLVSAKGYTVNSELQAQNLKSLNGINRLNLTYGGNLGIGYNFNNRWTLRAHTRYRIDARNMFDNNNVAQKMAGLGGDISLQLKLKR